MDSQSIRRIRALSVQYKNAIDQPLEQVRVAVDETDLGVWHVLLRGFGGNEGEFTGGEYLCRLEAPAEFPLAPPRFRFLTKNGVFDVHSQVCVDIGDEHRENWRAVLGMPGFCMQLISGLIGWRELGAGRNIVDTSLDVKRALAQRSVADNRRNHAHVLELIERANRTDLV